MRILFVTPNSSGTGEAVSALHMGIQLGRSNHDVRYFADPFTSQVLRSSFAGAIDELSDDPGETRARWHGLLRSYKPEVVVFADYPLLFLSRRGRALVEGEAAQTLASLDAHLVTLDHLGMAQRPMMLPAGPPHLEPLPQFLPAVPQRMKILLPCPLHSPAPVPGRNGVPFRYWDPPFGLTPQRREEVRRQFLNDNDEWLIFHSVPTWAQEFCRRHRLPNYSKLTRVLEVLFHELPRPSTIVSVNGGSLLTPSAAPGLRVVNLGRLSQNEYDELLFASDLMITDNRISASLGKAVCGLVPCAALRNSYRLPELLERSDAHVRALLLEMERARLGSIFPFEVFPIWSREDLDALRVFDANPLAECMIQLEIYGGAEARSTMQELLTSRSRRQVLRNRQSAYVSLLLGLPDPGEALESML